MRFVSAPSSGADRLRGEIGGVAADVGELGRRCSDTRRALAPMVRCNGTQGPSVVEAKGTQPRRQRRLEKTTRSPRMSRIRGNYREIDFISGVAPLRSAGDRSGTRRWLHFQRCGVPASKSRNKRRFPASTRY